MSIKSAFGTALCEFNWQDKDALKLHALEKCPRCGAPLDPGGATPDACCDPDCPLEDA